jgi:hypothetical protein
MANRVFRCTHCGLPCHIDHLEWDDFGAGCPHCGELVCVGATPKGNWQELSLTAEYSATTKEKNNAKY